jgi:hypothetical protein
MMSLPGIQWADIEVLLYGAEESAKGPFGGLSAEAAIYLQTGHDIDDLEARSHGRFRIFSKLDSGSGGQFLDVGYACFPVLDRVRVAGCRGASSHAPRYTGHDGGRPSAGW